MNPVNNPLIDLINNIANTPLPQAADVSASNGIVRVIVKTHYGTKHYYPANGPAELFLKVQGGKVMTPATLKVLKAAGYAIEYRYDEERI